MKEHWLLVVGHLDYEVSDQGRVRSWVRPGRTRRTRDVALILKLTPDKDGYLQVQLGEDNMRKVHHLVLEAFVGKCPRGMQARHIRDRNVANNRLDNLAWGSARQNAADKVHHGTSQHGERNAQAKLTNVQAGKVRKSVGPLKKTAERYGVTESTVSRIRTGARRG